MAVGLRGFALVSALAGCGVEIADLDGSGASTGDGKGDGSGGGDGTAGLTASQFLDQIGMIQCDHAFSCKSSFPAGSAEFEDVFGPVAAVCYADTEAFYLPGAVESQIVLGKLHYNPAAAVTCLAGTTFAASCNDYWREGARFDASCDLVLLGQIPDGARCVTVFDCADPDSVCDAGARICLPGQRRAPLQGISSASSTRIDAGP